MRDDIITAPISAFCRMSGIGRTLVYEMLGDGRLQAIRIGRRRLIVIESYHCFIEKQRAQQAPATRS